MTPPNIKTIIDEFHDITPHTPLKIEETGGTEYDKGYIFYQDLVLRRLPEAEARLRTSLQSLAQNLIKDIEGRKKLIQEDGDYDYFASTHNASKDEEIEAIRRVFDLDAPKDTV